MALAKEPVNVDLVIKSKPWTKEELAELSLIIKKRKEKKVTKRKARLSRPSQKRDV